MLQSGRDDRVSALEDGEYFEGDYDDVLFTVTQFEKLNIHCIVSLPCMCLCRRKRLGCAKVTGQVGMTCQL